MKRRFNFAGDDSVTVEVPGWYGSPASDKYELGDLIAHGDLTEVFDGKLKSDGTDVIIKVCRNFHNSDLVEAGYTALTAIRNSPHWIKAGDLKLPFPLDSLAIGDPKVKRAVTVHARPPFVDAVTLKEVHAAFPVVDIRDAAWMFNRMIDALHCVHATGYVHGAVTPDHLLIEPESHRGQLLDLSYAVRAGQTAVAVSPQWRKLYAPEIVDENHKFPLTPSADIYMAAKCFLYLLGMDQPEMDGLPKPVFVFLRACLLGPAHRVQSAAQAHEDFRTILEHLYGPRTFRTFTMPTAAETE